MEHKLEVKDLYKVYGEKTILNHLNFTVENGEFLSILGPSGCGKTTLLRILVGIEYPNSGKILKAGKNITGDHPATRGMGIVFQNFALFPNMTVLQHVAYAMKVRTDMKADAEKRARDIIEKVGLTEHMDKKPSKLSGGQQQRVAIARTLALSPDIILFDEPMSALDAANRITLRHEIKDIQKKFGITMIYVTHDQEEAFSMSDKIIVMDEGNIVQHDTPKNIYHKPANAYVQNFVVDQLKEKITSIQESVGE